jgi:hypothetical protein
VIIAKIFGYFYPFDIGTIPFYKLKNSRIITDEKEYLFDPFVYVNFSFCSITTNFETLARRHSWSGCFPETGGNF